jgi:TolB-like protein
MKMPASSDICLFADFRFDRAGGGLFRRDDHGAFAPVTIGSRALDLLAVLIERRGDVVSKEEIAAAVWPKTAVENGNLFVQISTLRAILDGEQSGQSSIQTVAGRGYRFIAPVRRCAGSQSMPAEILEPTRSDSASKLEGAGPPHLSIVVLPFANLGDDPEQEYFADGVTDCLTTDLSRISGAFVIGRSTAFTYKGKAADVRQIGRELNVRYVLEGSVQRGGKCLRVNVQLLDTETASHIWAERFDKPIADLFDVQDEIVSQLANALGQELAGAEAVRAGRATNPDSMDHYFVGQAMARKGHTVAILDEARLQYDRALELDPDNVDALVARAWIDLAFVGSWLCDDGDDRRLSAEACVDKALKLRPGSATAHCALGALRMYGKRAAQGIAECGRALAIDRNFAAAHGYIGMAKIFAGRNEETEAHILEALRISPRDSNAWAWMLYGGMAKFRLGRDEEALAWLNRSVEFNPNSPATRFCLAATLAHLDRVEEAREAAGACLEINPSFTIARFRSQTFSDHPVYLAGRERMYEGLRRAGMPEG